MSSQTPSTSTEIRKQSNIPLIKQTKSSIPQEVKDLYNKPSTSRRQLWKQKPDPTANRIVNYFRKKNDNRSSAFETNRQSTLNPNLNPTIPIKLITECEDFKQSQKASAEAKAKALELSQAVQNKTVNQTDLLKLNSQMIIQMQNAHDLLSSAIIKRDNEIATQFASKINEATECISKELNVMRKEIDQLKSNDDIEKLSTINACKDDLKKLWIRFTYIEDITAYREKNNPPMVVKDILNQLDINLNKILWPIESASFKIKKFSYDQLPETALECTFINSTIADKVKFSIIKFNNNLEDNGRMNLIRYRVATDWSYQVRKILKCCNEMRKCGIVNKVAVTNEGIKVFHKEIHRTQLPRHNVKDNPLSQNTLTTTSSVVNSIKQLDSLRMELQDYNCYAPATEVYNHEYFEKPLEERLMTRNEFYEELTNEEQQMERTISDCSFSSIQERDK